MYKVFLSSTNRDLAGYREAVHRALDVGREGALPLLEFVLTRIWDGFLHGTSAADTVRALGGVGGALANQAQAVYDGLGPEERRIARRAFLAMVRLGEGTRDSRRRAPLAEIVARGDSDARVLALLRRFAEPGRRLITLAGSEKVDGWSTWRKD